jgi:hypothetical protein
MQAWNRAILFIVKRIQRAQGESDKRRNAWAQSATLGDTIWIEISLNA